MCSTVIKASCFLLQPSLLTVEMTTLMTPTNYSKLLSSANSEQIYLKIAFPRHSLSACLLATGNSVKIFNNVSERYCSFSFSNPISSRRKRFQHFEKQLNDNSVWGPDSNRKLCPLLIVAFLFVPVIAGIAQSMAD